MRVEYEKAPNNGVAFVGIDYQESFIEGERRRRIEEEKSAINFAESAKERSQPQLILLTKSEHPSDHFSFDELGVHCVKGSTGAKLVKSIAGISKKDNVTVLTRDSRLPEPPDSYSAFESHRLRPLESFHEILLKADIHTLMIGGFGHSWDVVQTAFDSAALSYTTIIMNEWCLEEVSGDTKSKLQNVGVTLV